MNSLKYILTICLMMLGFENQSSAQILSVDQISPTSGPYACGSVIQIKYKLEYLQITGNNMEVKLEFNPADLTFNTSSNTSAMTVSSPTTCGTGMSCISLSTPTTNSSDNNYYTTIYYTVSFTVMNNTCSFSPSTAIKYKLFSVNQSGSTLISSNTENFTLYCAGANPYIHISLLEGNCDAGLYQIKTFGFDNPTSSISLSLPAGSAMTSLFNSLGNTETYTTSGNTATWNRPGSITNAGTMQIFYAFITNAPSTSSCCPTSNYSIQATFISSTICTPNSQVSITSSYNLSNCCQNIDCSNNGGPGGPGTPPPGTAGVPGGYVTITKNLIKTPFRYLPAPDNCKTHKYVIEINNFSQTDLENFKVVDLLDNISTNFGDEIIVENVSLKLTNVFGIPVNFTADYNQNTIPSTNPVNINATGLNYSYIGSNPVFNLANGLIIERNGTFLFPKLSKLQITIDHRLNNPLAIIPYDNKASVDFDITNNGTMTHYNAFTNITSKPDNYDPIISIEKYIENLTTGTGFTKNISVSPSDAVNFIIKIKNYGMTPVTNAVLADAIVNPNNNLRNINSLNMNVTGIGYTSSELNSIKSQIISSLASTGFGVANFTINAAACNQGTELIIRYSTNVKTYDRVFCNGDYINSIQLNWSENGTPKTTTDAVTAKLDLFNMSSLKLEASCENPISKVGTANPTWSVNQINGIPGQPIYYRVGFKNNNTFPLSNIKLMIHSPSTSPTSDWSSTHNFNPVLNLNATASAGSMSFFNNGGIQFNPVGSGVAIPSSLSLRQSTNNWLSNQSIGITTVSGQVGYAYIANLQPGAQVYVYFRLIAPYLPIGNSYITEVGASMFSSEGCPIVAKRTITETLSTSNNCASLSDCALLNISAKAVSLTGAPSGYRRFRINITNITDLNGGTAPNIAKIEAVVHNPTKGLSNTLSAYRVIGASGLNPTALAVGDRIVKFNGPYTSPPVNASSSIDVDIPNSFFTGSNSFSNRIPVNFVFRLQNEACTFCEKTIYLNNIY